MEDFALFVDIIVDIIIFVWAILCLILFCKIWSMTNNVEKLTSDVHRLTLKLCENQAQATMPNETEAIAKKQSPVYDFEVGEYVYVIDTRKKTKICKINGTKALCDFGAFSGLIWFDCSRLTRNL